MKMLNPISPVEQNQTRIIKQWIIAISSKRRFVFGKTGKTLPLELEFFRSIQSSNINSSEMCLLKSKEFSNATLRSCFAKSACFILSVSVFIEKIFSLSLFFHRNFNYLPGLLGIKMRGVSSYSRFHQKFLFKLAYLPELRSSKNRLFGLEKYVNVLQINHLY